jgi:hypothetical protein
MWEQTETHRVPPLPVVKNPLLKHRPKLNCDQRIDGRDQFCTNPVTVTAPSSLIVNFIG